MSFEKSFEHSDKLFEAAVDEFCAAGYEQASINTILQNAGMSKGQFYYHFKSKEGLYFALIDLMIKRKAAFLSTIMQPADFQQDIFGIFATQIKHSMAFAREFPAINRFGESFVRERGNPIYDKALAQYNFVENDRMGQLIERAYHNGDFRTDLPLSFIKKTIGYLFTHVAELADLNNMADFESNLNYLVAFMKGGLAQRPDE